MKYLFIILLSFLTFSSFAQQTNEEENDQPRKVRYGFRINTPLTKGDYVTNSKENLYNLDVNVLVKIKLISNFIFFQPEVKLPLGNDSINTQLNLLVKVGGCEVLCGTQYNFNNNKYTSCGMNLGLNKRIIPQMTIGFGCYFPNKTLENISDNYVFNTYDPKFLYFNIQFRF